MTLKNTFLSLVSHYNTNDTLAEKFWQEVEMAYGAKKRHYHNLMHLQNMCRELQIVTPLITDHDTIMFALFYHDIVYKATAKDNEEKSVEKAIEVLNFLNYPEEKKLLCAQHILATKSHDTSSNADTNFLLDADMSILGKPWPEYEAYFKAVRKEYAIYPDFLYNPGRRKVLHYFLSMDAIYKTSEFKDRYEKAARTNIEKELLLYH